MKLELNQNEDVLENSKTIIFGLGVSGISVARYLDKLGLSFIIVDDKIKKLPDNCPKTALISSKEAVESLCNQDGYTHLVISPGISQSHPLVQKASLLGVHILGDVELAFRFFKNKNNGKNSLGKKIPKILAITGSNGKTTTTMLAAHILECAGLKAETVGNIGTPLLDYLEYEGDALVVELSSFQLETAKAQVLDACLCTKITPNHLDRHGSMDEYAKVKFNIFNCLKKEGKGFIFESIANDFNDLMPRGLKIYGRSDASYIKLDGRRVIEDGVFLGYLPKEIHMAESHDAENFLAAYLLVGSFQIPFETAISAYSSFQKPPHRIQYVTTFNGVSFWDDSKGTNLDATMKAVDSIEGPIILIAGGVHKGEPYHIWSKFKNKVSHIVALGQAAHDIEQDLAGVIQTLKVQSLKEAVLKSFELSHEGFSVLLSPGCASYDMFRDYKDRGMQFQSEVLKLKEEVRQ